MDVYKCSHCSDYYTPFKAEMLEHLKYTHLRDIGDDLIKQVWKAEVATR